MNFFRRLAESLGCGEPPHEPTHASDVPSGWQPLFNDDALSPGWPSPFTEEKPTPQSAPDQPNLEDPEQSFLTYPIPPDHIIEAFLSPEGEFSVFKGVVGHDQAKRPLGELAFASWKHIPTEDPDSPESDHLFSANILFTEPASGTATPLVRAFVTGGLRLPLVEVNGGKLGSAAEILAEIAETLLAWDAEWRGRGGDPQHVDPFGLTLIEYLPDQFYPPPMVIFIDEAHRLRRPLQEMLLRTVESDDRVLRTEAGATVDCSRVAWILATTAPEELVGRLVDCFLTIELH